MRTKRAHVGDPLPKTPAPAIDQLRPETPERKEQRWPLAVSTHLESDPHDQRVTIRVTTLVFDDGSVWRQDANGWVQVYTLGDEEQNV